jgi:quercetin dioxygenase-like cupin family protein
MRARRRNGFNPRRLAVPLARHGEHASLVAWQPGFRTRDHTHPNSEAMFVLGAEIRNANERNPDGR